MANHELVDHKYAIVENEFRYLPYADTEGDADTKVDADIRILPPVTELDKTKRGHAFAHAVVCAVEARYHKKRNRCYPPKSMWRCSVKSLIKTMSTRLKLRGIWTIKTIDRLVSEYGIGLMGDEKHPEQCGPKYRGVHFESFTSNDKSQYDKLFDEIHENGPIIAFFRPSDDFEDWSPELAKERVYSGYSPSNKHVVALIGTSYFHDGSKYLIAQNCYGEEWGEKGVFRMLPEDVDMFGVPIIPDAVPQILHDKEEVGEKDAPEPTHTSLDQNENE